MRSMIQMRIIASNGLKVQEKGGLIDGAQGKLTICFFYTIS